MDHTKNNILQTIHEEMLKGTFNDLDIVCENGTTSANRLVLAAMSSYFRAMLTSDMTESRTGILNLPTVSVSVFQDVVKMSLCSVDLVNEQNCVNILDASEMMQLDDVKDLCHRYLKERLVFNINNCLHWWRLMNRYNVPDLSNRAVSYLTEKLTDFVERENIVHLSKTELLEILSKNDLKCKEDMIMKGVMKWLETNNPDADDVKHIFSMIKINLVDPKFLVENVVFSKFEEHRIWHCMVTANSKVYTIGGFYSNTIEEMSESGTRWQVVGDLNQKREFAFADTVRHSILVMGGRSGGSGSDVIQCFNTATRCVSNLSSRLPYSSLCLRGSVHLPDVYLLDYDGNVMHVQVTDSDGEIKIQVKSTAKWRSFEYSFGVSWQNGNLLSFSGSNTNCEVRKYNLAEGKEEHITFPESTRSGTVYGVLRILG